MLPHQSDREGATPVSRQDGEDRSSGELRQFLGEHSLTHDHLQVLLLLRSRREHRWTATAVSLELQLPLSVSAEIMEHLSREGFLYPTGGTPESFVYLHASDETERWIQRLSRANDYDRRRLAELAAHDVAATPGRVMRMLARLWRRHHHT